MVAITHRNANTIGILSAVSASVFFSINDVVIKFLSGAYALHEVVLIRSLIGLVLLLVFIFPLQGGMVLFRTRRLGAHLFRAACVVFANMSFFLGLASMPLAEAVAIFFVSPLIITTFSVIFLKEHVGPHRWAAVGIGLVGVLIVMRPGTQAFQMASLFPLGAAVGYAGLHTITRRIGGTENPATMTFYIMLVFIVVSAIIGLAVGDGRFAVQDSAAMEFFFREWVVPDAGDFWLFVVLGACSTAGGFLISQAYRLCESGLAAPFEYVALPLSIMFGILVFGEWPDAISWLGTALIITGGIYMFVRESRTGLDRVVRGPTKIR